MQGKKETRPAAKQGARNVLGPENGDSLSVWTTKAQIALAMPLVVGMLAVLAMEVVA